MTTTNGSLSMSMRDNGKFTGAANGTQLDLTFGDKSAWHLTADSSVTSLTGNGALINFAGLPDQGEAIHTSQYRKLQTQAFKGTGNTLAMHIDLANETVGQKLLDQFVVAGKAEGTHVAQITFDSVDDVKTNSINWLISQGEGSNMTITNRDGSNTFSGRGMVSVWSLGFVHTGEETLLDTEEGRQQIAGQTTGLGEGNWFLVKNEVTEPDPNPEPLPPEVEDNLVLGIIGCSGHGLARRPTKRFVTVSAKFAMARRTAAGFALMRSRIASATASSRNPMVSWWATTA